MSEADEGKILPFPGGAPRRGLDPPPGPLFDEERRRRGRIIDRLNETYAVVDDHGKVWIFKLVNDVLRQGYRTVYRLTEKDFRLYHLNHQVSFHVKSPTARDPEAIRLATKSEAEWWLSDARRRTYRDVVFAPGKVKLPSDVFNLFRGLAVVSIRPRVGSGVGWPCMRRHLIEVICSGNHQWFDYLMDWMALMFQRPGEVGQTAVVLKGGEGVGKGILARYLLKIFGPYGLHLSSAQQLHGHYNVHLQNCIFLFSDEAYYPGDKSFEGMLRAMITEQRLPIEPKYQNLFETINCLHFLISSNNQWVVPMAIDARRFFVLLVSALHKGDKAYWDPLWYELEHGGPSAMLGELLERDISCFDVRAVPDTPEGRLQKRLSLKTVEEYWMAALERGYPYRPSYNVPSVRQWREFWSTEWLWRGYQQWCDDAKRWQRQSREDFGVMLTGLYGKPGRPREWHPSYETEKVLPGGRGHQPVSHQDWLQLDESAADRSPGPAGRRSPRRHRLELSPARLSCRPARRRTRGLRPGVGPARHALAARHRRLTWRLQ